MQRKRDGLVPIAEALADLPAQVQALRDYSETIRPKPGTTSPLPIRCTSWSRPVKRTPIWASWPE